jgi:CRP-like cAMP-binding protein
MENIFQEKNHFDFSFPSAQECLDLLSADEKKELINHKINLEFNVGEVIIRRGVLANHIPFLIEGLVKIEFVNDNKLATVALVQSNSFIGIVCCFAFEKFDFTVTAIENSKVSLLEKEVFINFIRKNGEFSLALIKHMSGVANGMLHRLTRMSQKNIEGALSIIILDFAAIYNSTTFTLPMKRKELAEMLDYSKESVINTLSKYNSEGIINVDGKKIEILDMEKLVQISKFG